MTTEGAKPGLRDRKRAQTWARIELAAVELVLRDGLDATTIDAISERADISPRTFFNYFDSKDAAVLGVRPSQVDDDVMAEQLAIVDELDPVVAVVHLVTATMGVADSVDSGLHRRRLEIIRRHPDVIGSQFAQLNARKDRLATHVAELLAPASQKGGDATAPDLTAPIVLALCASAVRTAIEVWATNPDSTDDPTPDDGNPTNSRDDEVELIEQQAVRLVHSTIRRLA